MTYRNSKLAYYLGKIYCPVNLRHKLTEVQCIVKENDYREILLTDHDTMIEHCLIILTKGKGSRETFAGYRIARIDVGEVTESTAMIAVYNPDTALASPMRIARDNIKYNIIKR